MEARLQERHGAVKTVRSWGHLSLLSLRMKLTGHVPVSVMLFEGWGVQFAANAWRQHPFHPDNNINGIRGDLDGDGRAVEIHTGRIAEITALQRGYVRHVIETVNSSRVSSGTLMS
jgi:hypothetical protein